MSINTRVQFVQEAYDTADTHVRGASGGGLRGTDFGCEL